jgi:hypothetical protein
MKTIVYTLLLTGLVATSAFAKQVTFKNISPQAGGAKFTLTIAGGTATMNSTQTIVPQASKTVTLDDQATISFEAQSTGSQNMFGKTNPKKDRKAKSFADNATYELSVKQGQTGDKYYIVVNKE